MSIFTVENQGVNTYLVYKVNAEDEFDSLSFGMLANNKIRGIAPILFTQMDSDKFLKYNISSKIPVSQFLKGSVTKKRLLGVFSGIASAYTAAEEYMVDTSLFVLDIDHIYVDATTNETTLICLPIVNGSAGNTDLQLFFKQIIYGAQFDSAENCDYVATLINYLNRVQVFSITDFKELVDKVALSTGRPAPGGMDATVRVAPPVQRPAAPAPQPQAAFTQNKPQMPPAPAPVSAPVAPPAAPVQGGMQSDPFGDLMPLGGMPSAAPPVPKKAEKQKKNKKGAALPPVPGAPAQAPVEPENQISLMTLLTKFSKENLELYKAQKANKKGAAAQAPAAAHAPGMNFPPIPAAPPAPPVKAGKAPKAPKAAPPVNFAIPGQTPSVNGAPAPAMPPITPVAPSPAASAANRPVKADISATAGMPQLAPKTVAVQAANFGETTVLGAPASGETTVLGVTPSVAKPVPHLVRYKTGEKVAVNKPIFRIGKEKSYVDYFISDNTAISRSHADIVVKGNNYYLVDHNSTNHTFVNGTIIESGVENKINPGDKIRFANEEFDFILI